MNKITKITKNTKITKKNRMNNKMNKRKWFFFIATIGWMSLIFSFSARPADLSTKDSNYIGELIGSIVIPNFSDWSEEEQIQFAQMIDHPVRKTAHATEYAILGLLILGCYADSRKSAKKQCLIAWLLGTAYAVSDEFHQLFVPGRSGQISDVLLDSTGVLVGVCIGMLVLAIYSKQKQSRNEAEAK